MKDHKKPPFSKSRQANPIVKPLPSTVASSATAAGTYMRPFQSATLAYSWSRSPCNESIFVPQLPEHSTLSGSDPPPPRGRFATSYPSKSSSVSLIQSNARTTSVYVPRPHTNNHLDESLARPITYDQNHPPGGPSSLLSSAKTQPTMKPSHMQQDTTIKNADYDMVPAIFGAPSVRISSELPTASHQDHPCFVPDLPTATTSPSQPGISQPSKSQTTCRATSLPTTGVKRRLGMGRTTGGYSNKKFKPPT